ncbi:hypothetical protein NMY22_g16443 [Coprinellus aureogranulatus]|nr:hypothetical protein NMY22_g16443 [Coprinellus aureogranulatus]
MSNLELEHAATAPQRFLSLVKRIDPDDTLLPLSSRDLIFRRSLHLEDTYIPRRLFLLPGGRFLLVSSEDLSLTLWDLGYNMHIAPKPYPIGFRCHTPG